jgi:hypothetical protein
MTTSIPGAVFDCVVLLQAAASTKGPASVCRRFIDSGYFLRDLTDKAEFLSDIPQVIAYPRDPDDEPYINLAVAADARYLVTWDNDLLDLMDDTTAVGLEFQRRFPDLRVLTPVALIRELSAPSNGPDAQG